MSECKARLEIEIDLKDYRKATTLHETTHSSIENVLLVSGFAVDSKTAKNSAYHLAKWHCTCGECPAFFNRNFK